MEWNNFVTGISMIGWADEKRHKWELSQENIVNTRGGLSNFTTLGFNGGENVKNEEDQQINVSLKCT